MTQQAHLEALVNVLDQAWQGGFSSRSDVARLNAEIVSMATERNLITTRIGPNLYGNKHLITPLGINTLWSLKGLLT